MSNFQNPSVALGKKVAISGCGGKNMTQSCRAKLTELLDFMKMDLMHEPQTGIALGREAWTKGEFVLTDEQKAELQKQADAFSVFLEKNVAANLLKGVNYGSFFLLYCSVVQV